MPIIGINDKKILPCVRLKKCSMISLPISKNSSILNFRKIGLQLSFLFLIIMLLPSCQVKDIKVGDIQSFQIEEITKDYILVNLAIPVQNDNAFSFTVSKVDLTISVNEINLGKIEEITPIRIPKKSSVVQQFVFQFKLADLDKESVLLIPALLSNEAKMGVKGYMKASKFLFSKKIDVNYHKETRILR